MKTYLKEWMEHLNIGVRQLSEDTGISEKVILKWTANEITPPLASICKIADALAITVDDLINSKPSEFANEFKEFHIIESMEFKTISRLQKYFESIDTRCEALVLPEKDNKKRFILRYDAMKPLEPKEIAKIAKKRKYFDKKERLDNLNLSKYEDMTWVNM